MEAFAGALLLPLAADETKLQAIKHRSNAVTKTIAMVLCFISNTFYLEQLSGRGIFKGQVIRRVSCVAYHYGRAPWFDLLQEVKVCRPGEKISGVKRAGLAGISAVEFSNDPGWTPIRSKSNSIIQPRGCQRWGDEVSTESGSDRVSTQAAFEIARDITRSLPLSVLTSSFN